MNIQPTLTDNAFYIRPLLEADIAELAKAAADPLIWEQHPAKERGVEAQFIPYAYKLLETGGTVVFIKKDEDRIIGCSKFYPAPNAPQDMSIGFTFIQRVFWGKGVNFALKSLMFNHLFQSEERVWLHIAPENFRSQRATEKLGACKTGSFEIDPLNTGIASMHYCYLLTKAAWNEHTQS